MTKFFNDKCPKCEKRELTLVNWIRATVLINNQRAPDSWSYYLCERCNSRLKLHRDVWSDVNIEEWTANCAETRS